MDLSKFSDADLLALKKKDYSALSDDALMALTKKASESIPESPPKEKAPVDFSFAEMGRNVIPSLVQYGKDMAHAVTSPVETAKAVGNVALGGAQKLIPGQQDSERYFDQMIGMYGDRYGDSDSIKRTLMQDPVGVLADASSVVMAGGGAARLAGMNKAGSAVTRAGAALDPIQMGWNATARPLGRSIAKLLPDELPHKLYESSAKFSTTLTPEKRRKLSETAVREGIKPTPKGAIELEKKIIPLEQKIGTIIDDATARVGDAIHVEKLFKYFDDELAKHGGTRLEAARDKKIINQVKQQYMDHVEDTGRAWLTPKEVQDFKTNAYAKINWDAARGRSTEARDSARKAAARAAKSELEGVAPDLKDLNKRLGELYELRKPLVRSSARIENRNIVPFDAMMKIGALSGAGYAMGGPVGAKVGTGAGVLSSIMEMPRVKANMGIGLYNAMNNPVLDPRASGILWPALRQALAESGQIEQQTSKKSGQR